MSDSTRNTTPVVPPVADLQQLQVSVDSCWSRIGVLGDGSCTELAQFTHCRNCPVYANAGAKLLERSLLPDYRRHWAIHFARPKSRPAPGALSVVLFRIGTEWLALPTAALQEVAEIRKVHSIPHRRAGAVLGLVNVRGELVACVSLAKILGFAQETRPGGERPTSGRLLVANWEAQRIVFPVDEVHGVLRFDPDALREPPATLAKSGASYTRGVLSWEGRMALCLDTALLFPALSQSLT